MPPKPQPPQPVVRIAPVGELNVYQVTESELDELAKGGTSSLWLNFALALLPTGVGIVVTMRSSQLSDTNFVLFTCVAVILFVIGAICFVVWVVGYKSSRKLVEQIKRRMPPPAQQIQTPSPTPTP
jgi:Flp pilus assembly protein TadB